MASPPTDKQRIRQKAKSLRFDLVRGWVLSYFPVELRSSLFTIPVSSHERSFNLSSDPLFSLYSIITIPTAPCSSRLMQELQYYLQQRVGASCLFAYTPWLILSYESSSWFRRILHLLLGPTSRRLSGTAKHHLPHSHSSLALYPFVFPSIFLWHQGRGFCTSDLLGEPILSVTQ
jgi:hypothetical protein